MPAVPFDNPLDTPVVVTLARLLVNEVCHLDSDQRRDAQDSHAVHLAIALIEGEAAGVTDVGRNLLADKLAQLRSSRGGATAAETRVAYDPLPTLADLVAATRGQSGPGVIARELIRSLRLPGQAATDEIERAIREVIAYGSNGPNVYPAGGQCQADSLPGSYRGKTT